MSLAEIVKYNADYVSQSGFSVSITSNLPVVVITDFNDPDGGFFLDGHEAEEFISEIIKLSNELEKENDGDFKDLTQTDLELSVAKSYIDCL